MTNKEKAFELYLDVEQPNYDDERLSRAFIRGAEWKEQQFKEYLEKIKEELEEEYYGKFSYSFIGERIIFLDEIIEGLFENKK